MIKKYAILLCLAVVSCTSKVGEHERNRSFSMELAQLQTYFHVPGLSVIVKQEGKTLFEAYSGFADVDRHEPMDSLITVPMASLTKVFSGILIMKLVEDGKLSLDESINKYATHESIADSIKIKHVLSHTSQGNVGTHFLYSNRFGWITQVIETKYEKPFEQVMHDQIIGPLQLKNTFLLRDSAQLAKGQMKVARPYFWDGKVTDGFVDFGYSAAAGVVSTVRDLAKLSEALDDNTLINEHSRMVMFTPPGKSLPYGYGIFSQRLHGIQLIWGYGQYDCYSSLFLKVPERNLTLIIAGNNNLLSDPARLIYGDVTYSLFALSFLKNYVFEFADIPLLEDQQTLSMLQRRIDTANGDFYRRKLIAQSIAESYLAMHEVTRGEQSKRILSKIFEHFPNVNEYGDLTLLHNLSFLKAIAAHNGQENFTDFDKQLKSVGLKLLEDDKANPYANYYLANYYIMSGHADSASVHYGRILTSKNFSRNWYTTEAENWMKEQTGSKP